MIELYGASWCRGCRLSKEYLKAKNIEYTYYEDDGTEEFWDEIEERCGARAIPQILIYDNHIGGYLDLKRIIP